MRIAYSVLLQVSALSCAMVTVASGNYTGVLIAALVLTLLALLLLYQAFRRGGRSVRSVCILLSLPSVVVILDCLSYAIHVFR